VSIEDEIRATVASYVSTFGTDREACLDLFAPDATVEDPVGSDIRRGREEIGEFWDISHSLADSLTLHMVQGPGIRGNEAAFAMEAHAEIGGSKFIAPTIDVMTFDDDGKITSMRAFWGEGDARPA
jgi:steroid delta-isomerase